ncbi:MAG TPA: bifunctional aspartate kinase/diaminopimelate decarboxylase [Steroidobacteraceae bacterium]|nr:bifunctional aspartate kinase/diaminopimelate decarboxylase [Steroidobacteraceae bacterium]
MTRTASDWIVLKFGGTSVSSLANWRNIAKVTAARRAEGARVLIVHSAVTGITDRLEKLLSAARGEAQEEELRIIDERHRRLAAELGIPLGPDCERGLAELRQIAAGIALIDEVSDRTRARVMSSGELLATDLGARFLRAQGLEVDWADARTMLLAEERGASAKANILNTTCSFAPDPALVRRLAGLAPIVVTQGFIASDTEGNTVLLGRGGSDTSAAYLAAKLGARRLEIWTDVPGMFSANPRSTPTARLLRSLHYDEAQEIATSGAKVLHPRCILPARQYRIPLHVYATQTPDLEGTILSAEGIDGNAQVKAVCTKKGLTLISLESPGMWHQVGFLADAFQVFKSHGMSVDLISTSETTVTVSLDPAANSLDQSLVEDLVSDLSQLCRVEVIGPCASVSLVGRNIRAILHQLGGAFEFFEEQKIYLVSQAANDLNFTFVVDERQGDRLVDQLHELLIRPVPGDRVLGPTWQELSAPQPAVVRATPWWWEKRARVLKALGERETAYIYDLDTVRAAARALRDISSVQRVHYAMKANPHPALLTAVRKEGLEFECVSRQEAERVLALFPDLDPRRVLYTPNFASRDEYAWALQRGVQVTVDNGYVLHEWGSLFRDQEIFIRVDTGVGAGHHHHVRTAGAHAKFGVPVAEVEPLVKDARKAGARVVGLQAHVGSGIFDVTTWQRTARQLADLAQRLEGVRAIDVGGGIGVPEHSDQPGVDLAKLDTLLAAVRAEHPRLEFWLEPGRYLAAPAGVLLARVTQLKSKGEVRYVGVATGMNSLIRPALYGSYHEIANLTRLGEPATEVVNIVGPICESADVLGHDRLLPPTREGDIILIANAGAYGHCMSSHYNLRDPAEEVVL